MHNDSLELDFTAVELRVAAHFDSLPSLTRKHIKGWCRVAGVTPKWWWSTKHMRKECLKALQTTHKPYNVEGVTTGRMSMKKSNMVEVQR